MPKQSDPFQTLVAQIQQHTGLHTGLAVEESKMLLNASTGKQREVDIVVQGAINGVEIVISFECCKLGRRPGSPWVEGMIGKHRHLPTHRLILVSESGFTKPALLSVDNEKDVEAVSFEDAADVDWGAYADRFASLRFAGFEFKPTRIQVQWEGPSLEPDKSNSIDENTMFRRISDRTEVSSYQLCLAYLRDERIARPIMDVYYRNEQIKDVRISGNRSPMTASGFAEPRISWGPDAYDWEIDLEHGTFPVISITIGTGVYIKDSPMEISYKSFMGTAVAHAIIEKPFQDIERKMRDQVSVALTKTPLSQPVASISYTTHAIDEGKTFFAKFAESEDANGEGD